MKGKKEIRDNYDSSDMVGYGYYLYNDKAKFTYDNKWNYLYMLMMYLKLKA